MEHEHSNPSNETASTEEALALLKYMAQHNAHHADELSEIVPGLPAMAAKHIADAVALLRQSTAMIETAIKETEA